MGWNRGYQILEATVVTVYDEGILTRDLLNKLMQPYVGADVDHGGRQGLKSKDGLSADEIVCKIMCPEEFAALPIKPCIPGECILDCNSEGRSCQVSEIWHRVTKEFWDFW